MHLPTHARLVFLCLSWVVRATHAGIIGYALVDCVKCPAPLAVLVGGVYGVIGWAAHMH